VTRVAILSLLMAGCTSPSLHRLFGLSLDGGVVSPTDSGVIVSDAQSTSLYYAVSLDAAIAAQQAVDKALGMPIAGRDIGGGVHVPASQSVTTTYAAPLAVQGGYLYPADAVTKPVLSDAGLPSPIAVTFVDAGPDGAIIIADAGVSANIAKVGQL
jgi:hypothetical protein